MATEVATEFGKLIEQAETARDRFEVARQEVTNTNAAVEAWLEPGRVIRITGECNGLITDGTVLLRDIVFTDEIMTITESGYFEEANDRLINYLRAENPAGRVYQFAITSGLKIEVVE